MNKSDRDKSGYEFSAQAADMLDGIDFTPEGVDRFFRNLSRKSYVELPRFRVRFFISGNKVCVCVEDGLRTHTPKEMVNRIDDCCLTQVFTTYGAIPLNCG